MSLIDHFDQPIGFQVRQMVAGVGRRHLHGRADIGCTGGRVFADVGEDLLAVDITHLSGYNPPVPLNTAD